MAILVLRAMATGQNTSTVAPSRQNASNAAPVNGFSHWLLRSGEWLSDSGETELHTRLMPSPRPDSSVHQALYNAFAGVAPHTCRAPGLRGRSRFRESPAAFVFVKMNRCGWQFHVAVGAALACFSVIWQGWRYLDSRKKFLQPRVEIHFWRTKRALRVVLNVFEFLAGFLQCIAHDFPVDQRNVRRPRPCGQQYGCLMRPALRAGDVSSNCFASALGSLNRRLPSVSMASGEPDYVRPVVEQQEHVETATKGRTAAPELRVLHQAFANVA